jgi:hypothetical protein
VTPKQLSHPVFAAVCDECGANLASPCLVGKKEGVHAKRVAQAVRRGAIDFCEVQALPFMVITDKPQDEEAERRKFVRHLVSDDGVKIVAASMNAQGQLPTKRDVESGQY